MKTEENERFHFLRFLFFAFV